MLRARLLPPAVFLGGALALVVAAVVTVSLLLANGSPASAQDDGETKVPAKPTGLSVATEPGSLDVLADWNDVEGADDYLVRWRPKDGRLNDGARVASSSAAITVDDYGDWVVRVQACNDAGCGKVLARQFSVEPLPEPTPTPAREPTATPEPTPEPAPGFRVSVAADATELKVNEEVALTAVITNAPSDQDPEYKWQLDLGGGSWYSAGTEATFSYLQNNAGSTNFRVTVTYGSGDSATSDPITITWVPPNRPPMVDDQAEHRAGFIGAGNAPRGTLVSKVYDGIFSDPDGDELTYTVSVPADRSELVDTVYVLESAQRVFIRLDAADDWGAVTPVLPKPLVTTVTLTATDPDGLSASVTGEFRTNWEQNEILAVCDRTSQVRDVLAALLGKACQNIGAEDLSKVVRLDLSNTGMSSLRQGDFSGMSSLREVDVSSNTFTQWSEVCGTGKWGASVTDINLNNNKDIGGTGAALPGNCFVSAPNLKTLHLAGTRINSLPANAFGATGSRLTNLWWLDLSRNQIAALDVNVFDGLSNLWYLDLGRNKLTKGGLPSSASGRVFDDLSSLEWLALNNQKAHDANDNFEPTGNPTLTGLDGAVFTGLSSLKELDLANNGLTTAGLVSNVFSPLTSLESLALFGNAGNASTPWTVTELIAMGVRNNGTILQASVVQVVAAPIGFKIEPVSGGVKLTWDDPSDTSLSYQYRFMVADGADWTTWTAISNPTSSSSKFTHTISSGVSSGNSYAFQLRSVKSGAHSWRANADCTAIFGTSGNDTLTGSPYPDCISGLAGNDTLEGRSGADKLDGGAGTDTATYAGSVTGVEVDLSISTGQVALGNSPSRGDVLSNIENIIGTDYDDTLTGDANANVIKGGTGADTMTGGAGADTMTGGNGNDVIEGGVGGDTLNGGVGTDTLSYAGSGSFVTVNLATPAASGGHATGDTISNFENITGSAHADTLTGDANANVIKGGTGGDTLNGAGGSDTVSYAGSSAGVTVTVNGTVSGGDAAGDTISNFESILGSAHADTLTGNASANVIEGGAGGDTMDGAGGSDTVSYAGSRTAVTVTINGTVSGGDAAGDTISNFENIIGSTDADTLTGDENANVIEGGALGDTLDCAGGTDTVSYAGAGAGVTMSLDDGTENGGDAAGDTISNCENINGSDHADSLTGDENVNVIAGGKGDDVIEGGRGGDAMTGGAGTDTLSYRFASRPVYANFGDDEYEDNEAQGDSASGFENLVGSKGGDELVGDANNNVIWGLGGQDEIDGRAGDDVIAGGASADEMDGGAGTDTLTYASSHQQVYLNLIDSSKSRGCDAQGDTVSNFEKVIGTSFDDYFTSKSGGLTFDGGAGNDTIIYRDSPNIGTEMNPVGVTVNLTTGTGSGTGSHAAGDKYISIENIVGSQFNDTLTGDAGDNIFEGMGGTDAYDGKDGTDTVVFRRVSGFINHDMRNHTYTGIERVIASGYGGDWLVGDSDDNILMGGSRQRQRLRRRRQRHPLRRPRLPRQDLLPDK